MINIFSPYLGKLEKKNVNECLKTNWISSQGNFISEFERSLANYHKSKYCVVTSSCTTAIHLSLLCCGIKPGDEVICSNLSFIAPANMILLSGAKPVFVDIERLSPNIDPKKIEKKITKKTKAILVVHQFGHPCEMNKINKIAKKYNLKVIEDNAESIGAKFKNEIIGTKGDASTLSFFANKIITTGEGGAIITNNKKIADSARVLRDHGMSKKTRYKFIKLGFNYRMTNLQAAIGCAQIKNIKKILEARDRQFDLYKKLLTNNKHISFFEKKKNYKPVHWLTTIILKHKNRRKSLIKFLLNEGIESRIMIPPIHKSNHFKSKYNLNNSLFKNSIDLSERGLHLPSSLSLSKKQIEFICSKISKFFKEKNN